MATWVEGKPIPLRKNTLSDVNDVSEIKTPWARGSPLSDASNKALDPTTPTSHIFDEGKLSYNLCSVTKTLITPRPRVSPRPFSSEKSFVPFSPFRITQAPDAPSELKRVTSKVTPSGKLSAATGDEEARFRGTAAKHSLAASPLWSSGSSYGPESISYVGASDSQEDKNMLHLPSTPNLYNVAASSSSVVLNSESMADEERDYSKAKATTLVILETSTQKLKSNNSIEGDSKAGKWMSRDGPKDLQMPRTSKPFTLPKPSFRFGKCTLSAIQGIGTSDPAAPPLSVLEKLDQSVRQDTDNTDKERDIADTSFPRRSHPRKSRPLSSWLSGTTLDQKSETPIKHDENAASPEKPWLKKPRPLSMDLTARFEAAGSMVYNRNTSPLEESKENVPVMQTPGALFSGTKLKAEGSAAEMEISRSPTSPDDPENKGRSYLFAVKETVNSNPKIDISRKDYKGLVLSETKKEEEMSSRESKTLWHNDNSDNITIAASRKEEKEERTFTTSSKTKKEKLESSQEQHKSLANRELDNISSLEPAPNDENPGLGSNDRGPKGNRTPICGGMIKRRISLLINNASSSPAKAEGTQAAGEKEKINICVKQQVQSFISENKEQVQSPQRRSLPPRPLSSDITKLFETRAVVDAGRLEKQVDMTVFSSPEYSVLQNAQEQRGMEIIEKENEVERDSVGKGQLHVAEPEPEYIWSRLNSVKKVRKALDKGTTEEETSLGKMIMPNDAGRKREMKIGTSAPETIVASTTKLGSQCSDRPKSEPEPLKSELLVKPVRVFVAESETQHQRVPEIMDWEGSSNSADSRFDKGRRSEQTSKSGPKSYLAMRATVRVTQDELESKNTTSSRVEDTPLERKEKIYFETEEQSDSGFYSGKITERNVPIVLPAGGDEKVGVFQKVCEEAVCPALPTTSTDRVDVQSTRRSNVATGQTKLKENVCGVRRRWNQPHPTENNTSLAAPDSDISGVEVFKIVQVQQSILSSAKPGSDKVGKKPVKVTRHSSFNNPGMFLSKPSTRHPDLRKCDDLIIQDLLLSARSKKDPKCRDNIETKHWLQDEAASDFYWKAPSKAGRDEKSKKVSSEVNADQMYGSSTEAGYKKHSYVSTDWRTDSFREEFSKDYPKFFTPEKPKSTLLTEEFLAKPWTDSVEDSSEEAHVTPTVQKSKAADVEKPRKTKCHNVLDLDVFMAEYRIESSARKIEEPNSFHYQNKKSDHHSKALQKDYEEHGSPKLSKSADLDAGKSSLSGKRKSTSDKLIRKALHRSSILDLDALMADYTKESTRPADVPQKTSGSKLTSGLSPGVKIQETFSPLSEEVTLPRGDQVNAYDGAVSDVKKFSKEEKTAGRPSSTDYEHKELRKYEGHSAGQQSEGERGGDPSPVLPVSRRPRHERRKSRPSSACVGHREVQQPSVPAEGQRTEAGRDRGEMIPKYGQGEMIPSGREAGNEEGRSMTPMEMGHPHQTPGGLYLDPETGSWDYLAGSRRSLHGSSYNVLEKEKIVEQSVDDEQRSEAKSGVTGDGEHSAQNSPRIMKSHPKDTRHLVSEVKKSRSSAIPKNPQRAADGPALNQEGTTADSKPHRGRRSHSSDRVHSSSPELSKLRLPSSGEDKSDSQRVGKEESLDFPRRTRRTLEDMIKMSAKATKPRETVAHSRQEVAQEKRHVHKTDRVKHCCITPITKEKDTDALVQERGQFCTPEDKDHYGTYEDRGSSNDELEVGSRNNELECYKDAIPPSPSKDRTGDPQSMSLSSQSEATPASEKILEPKSGLLSYELESTDDTDSSQSTCPPAQDDQTPPRFSFLEPVTTLDSCAQKSRIQLSRKTIRRAPTKHRKGGVGDYCDGTDQFLETGLEASMYKDSTEPRPFDLEELTTQEIKACEKPPVSQCQKVAMFPGMDPAVLKAGLRKTRPAGEDVDESNSKTCKLRSQQSFRVLPPTNGKGEGSEVAVPSWLQELKSKKRLSQLHSSSDQ
ncbi:uncharacterized protein KIAA1671 homolog isoform X2 [Amblyraja radiata]|uniref:uncharacterized protein KIAA1671 homolog isoform X2 n=1 Tax=Amblyraja radiata TaxID=386614 RepID=UPI00140290E5|nr:uncharacterized protein KIAA1671 homolog isoform X2 [Amblyraja radiata]